jgi:hypothetical protein
MLQSQTARAVEGKIACPIRELNLDLPAYSQTLYLLVGSESFGDV